MDISNHKLARLHITQEDMDMAMKGKSKERN